MKVYIGFREIQKYEFLRNLHSRCCVWGRIPLQQKSLLASVFPQLKHGVNQRSSFNSQSSGFTYVALRCPLYPSEGCWQPYPKLLSDLVFYSISRFPVSASTFLVEDKISGEQQTLSGGITFLHLVR